MEEWIDYLKKMGRKTQTVAMYKSHVQALQRWWEITGNQEPIWVIDSTDLETYKLYLERQSYSLSTLVQKFAAIKSFLNWAASVQLIDAIPKLPNFPPIQEQIHSSGWLTDDEVEAVLNDVELRGNLRDAAIIRLLLNIGLSADELCNLKWSDLNWNEQYITCNYRQIQQVPLSIAAIEALTQLQHPHPFLLWGQRGQLTINGLHNLVNKYGDGVTPFRLKNTYLRRLAQQGIPLKQLSLIANLSLSSVQKFYDE